MRGDFQVRFCERLSGEIPSVYSIIKWNAGDQDINKELMSWGGSCLFLVLVSVVIKAFFGV